MCVAVAMANTVCFHRAVVKIIMQRSPREFAANAASPNSSLTKKPPVFNTSTLLIALVKQLLDVQ
jgi:hypothetical protein